MKEDFPNDPEAQITALLLGELAAPEATDLRVAIEKDPALAALHNRLQQTIGLVKEAIASPIPANETTPAANRISEEKREKLLAAFKTARFETTPVPTERRTPVFTWQGIAAILALTLICAGLLLPSLAKSKAKAQRFTMRYAESDSDMVKLIEETPQPAAEQEFASTAERPRNRAFRIELPMAEGAAEPGEGRWYDTSVLNGPSPRGGVALPGGGIAGLGGGALPSEGAVAGNALNFVESTSSDDVAAVVITPNRRATPPPAARPMPGMMPGMGAEGKADRVATSGLVQDARKLIEGGRLSEAREKLNEAIKQDPNHRAAYYYQQLVNEARYSQSASIRQSPMVLPAPGKAGAAAPSSIALPEIVAGDEAVRSMGLNDNFGTPLNQRGGKRESESRLALQFIERDSKVLEPETVRGDDSRRREVAEEAKTFEKLAKDLKAKDRAQLRRDLPKSINDDVLNRKLSELDRVEQRIAEVPKESADAKKLFGEAVNLNAQIDNRLDGIVSGVQLQAQSRAAIVEHLAKQDAFREAQEAAAYRAVQAPVPQPEIFTAENAFSTFSLNVSDVSFKLAAASLEKGAMPEAASVRTEEFINAFDYRDPAPAGSAAVAFAWERARYPFAHDRDVLRFSIKTAAMGREAGRPLNIVLMLDNSGSMERADRVRIIQECLRALAGQLQAQDRISVVAFARTARLAVDGLAGGSTSELLNRVGELAPEGGTNLEEALRLAYATASRHFMATGANRIVMLTDGAANLGDVQPESLRKMVEENRRKGIALDCFGIGWEGLNDDLLEALSRNGDGRYGFVNTPEAAATEFATQLAGALQVAASDVKVQVEFNPRRATAFRQIGYAKHQLTKEQFRDNTVDAAEIGAAEAGNAVYVAQINPAGEGPIATVRARFKIPGTTEYREQEWTVPFEGSAKALEQSSAGMRLATASAGFGEWLATSPYAAEISPDRLLALLTNVPENFAGDPRPKQLQAMIRQAKSISGQ